MCALVYNDKFELAQSYQLLGFPISTLKTDLNYKLSALKI